MVRKISGNKNGFTLIELLIVIAIIEVLAHRHIQIHPVQDPGQ